MRYDRMMRFAVPLIAACAVLFPYSAAGAPQDAQASQDQSVADAARQARAAKKNAAKASKIISDDDIDTKAVKPGAEGLNVGAAPKSDAQPPSAAAVSAVEASDAKAAAAETGAPGKAGDDPEIAKAKAELAEAAKQLDLLQRGFALDSDSYYSKPDFSSDKDGKVKLDAAQQQIKDKQQEVDRLKAHLDELKALRKKAAPAGVAETPESETPAETPPAANSPQS